MFILSPQVVAVWTVAQDTEPDVVRRLTTVLSDDERHQAAQFRQPLDQTRFIIRRAALRLLLAEILGRSAPDIDFQRSAYGKPFVTGGPPKLEFNVSHSNALALIAVTVTQRVGIDVEWLSPLAEMAQIAARIFAADEHTQWQSLPADERMPAFYTAWTRKEAVVKALGKGLSVPLNRVAVLLPSSRLTVDAGLDSVPDWMVKNLPLFEGYVAAVAAEGVDWVIEQHEFELGT